MGGVFCLISNTMSKYYFLLLLTLASISWTDEPQENVVYENANVSTIKFEVLNSAPVAKSQQIASDWKSYNEFITALENNTHTVNSIDRLYLLSGNMLNDLPSFFDSQIIRSRILVLQTRLGSYKSFLSYRSKPKDEYKKRYGEVITALENLIGQMNEKEFTDRMSNELINELKVEDTPSTTVVQDSLP